jgi:hypothetical protein
VVFEHTDAVAFDSDDVIFIPQTARYSDDLRPEDRNTASHNGCCHGTPENSTTSTENSTTSTTNSMHGTNPAHGTNPMEDTNDTDNTDSTDGSRAPGGPEPPGGPTGAGKSQEAGKPQETGGSQRTGSPQSAGSPPMAAGWATGGSATGGPATGGAVAPCCCSAPGGPRAGSGGAGGSGVRANINVTISLDTLLGLNEEPGSLEGTEPITAVEARRLAFQAGSTWRRLVTDPLSGTLLDYGRTRYTPPVPLADHSRARDVTCTGVHCDRPAALCDLDHTDEYPNGATSDVNLHSLCRRDHRFKHEGGWRHEVVDDPAYPKGTIRITSPTGHVYLSHPLAIGPITPAQEPDQNQDEDHGRDRTALAR